MNNIITRFAPSPTGLFHFGSARTALFNYLFAKKNNGKFILRVEDTDPARSKDKYTEDIFTGMEWLRLKQDGKVTYQSQRKEVYEKYIKQLLEKELAYKKDGAIWFDLIKCQQLITKKDNIEFEDLILGKIKFKIDQFHDFVLIKSDGLPLYMFAATVDDHDMGVTHIVRGADHVNSTPQQIMLYQALEFEVPQFGHMPLILNTDKSKMSKRKNPVSVTQDFMENGYLSEAMINYIALLGWSPKNNQEFFTLSELEKIFDIKNVNKSPAVFDINKLNYFNNYYIRNNSNHDLFEKIKSLDKYDHQIDMDNNQEIIEKILEVIKPRMQKLTEFDELSNFFFILPNYDAEMLVFKKSDKDTTKKGLEKVLDKIEEIKLEDWRTTEKLNQNLLSVVADNNLTNGDVFWPTRVALSGMDKSPSPVEMLWVLGKEESMKRIKLAIDKLN